MKNKKVIICLLILCIIVFILGMHGGSEYYFRDFCVHKTLNMFYNNGSPEFFKKPNLVSDIQAVFYWFFYLWLKHINIVDNFDNFVRLFTTNHIVTPIGNIAFTLPALIVNNIFSALGVCFTFLTTYLVTNKKIVPSFIAGFVLSTTYIWMCFSHHLAVDIPLSALCIITIFFTLFFIKNKETYSYKDIIVLGILSGLCFATKYNGIIVAIAPFLVLLCKKQSTKDFFTKLIIFILSVLYTFFIANPYILIHFETFYYDLSYEYNHAFYRGHSSSDDEYPLLFNIFHSIPNGIGILLFIFSMLGFVIFSTDKKIKPEYKYGLLSFPVAFFIFMGYSKLVFLRYILPIIPFLTVFAGMFIKYILELNPYKIKYKLGIIIIGILLIQNMINAVHFYNIMSQKDTRVLVKEVYKTLNLDNSKINVMHSDPFSNPYYEDDFLNLFPDLKNDIRNYLICACNSSIDIFPRKTKNIFNKYDVLFFDNNTFDKPIQTRRKKHFSAVNKGYFMYHPHKTDRFKIIKAEQPFYVVQINPYKNPKEKVPFDLLISDFKYRIARGPFIEIYFKDKDLRDKFINNCVLKDLKCKSVNIDESYYYNNLLISNLFNNQK